MSDHVNKIVKQAQRLSKSQRRTLLHQISSLVEADTPPDVAAAWDEEIKRRMRDVNRGKAKCIPWETVRAQIRGRIRAAKRKAS